jgi:hypothetical protein
LILFHQHFFYNSIISLHQRIQSHISTLKIALFMRFISKSFWGKRRSRVWSAPNCKLLLFLSLPLIHSSERRAEIHLGIARTMGQKADRPLETEIGCTLKFSSSQGPIYPPLVQFKWQSSQPKAFLPPCLSCVRAGACIFQDPGALPCALRTAFPLGASGKGTQIDSGPFGAHNFA